jgi:Ran GTPase-activating protein (RanGAP) involved in mRNA processing and transport
MLSLEDARMLADMINKNTPLKTLNLSQNELDADCAALIANALIYNSNLTVLNLKDNRLGDLGV